MKKLLTILLALLVVTGVVFADPTYPANNDNATLTLTSSVDGFFKHGFLVDSETELGDYIILLMLSFTELIMKDLVKF